MMYGNNTIKLTKCVNGYVLEWDIPLTQSIMNQSLQSYPHTTPPTSGTEIFTTKKNMLKRVGELL